MKSTFHGFPYLLQKAIDFFTNFCLTEIDQIKKHIIILIFRGWSRNCQTFRWLFWGMRNNGKPWKIAFEIKWPLAVYFMPSYFLVTIWNNAQKQCNNPSIIDGVHRNENFVEIIPVFSKFFKVFQKKLLKSFYETFQCGC